MSIKRIAALLAALVAFFFALLLLQQGIRALERAAYPQKYTELVEQYAEENALPANLIYAMIRTESGFRPNVESHVGARGLMQITEETFDWIKMKLAPEESIVFTDLDDPAVNIRFGSYLLAACMQRYNGDISTACAAYHSGMGLVDELLQDAAYSLDGVTLHTFPYAQMNNYVNKINQNYTRYNTLYGSAMKE